MAYTTVATAVTGQTYTAANYNTYVRDNMAAIWVYTTAGDLSYAAAAASKARLAIGGAGDLLMVNSSANAPEWFGLGAAGQSLFVNAGATAVEWGQGSGLLHTWSQVAVDLSTPQTTSSTSGVDITGLTLDLTTTKTCSIFVFVVASVATSGGSAVQPVLINPFIDGSSFGVANVPQTQTGSFTMMGVNWGKINVADGTITCKAQVAIADSSRIANITRASLIAVAFTE